MATFQEFRDSFPDGSNDKGERFEIFLCEWFLKHHPVYKNKFRKVWRFTDWPRRWIPRDIGTDIIAEDSEGKICAIQAKCYREQNWIPKGHVDSFLADSARKIVDYRLLIAATDRIGINAENVIEGQAIPVQLFLLNDFINSPIEWPTSLEALSEGKRRDPYEARPHQQEAIEAVCSKLDDRGQLLMACGTGKTLTGQRIAEQLDAQRTLVLLPSLLLLSKTVVDWLTETKTDFSFLPVCSDATVTKKVEDEIRLSSSELGVRPTTDEDEIADFLRSEGRKVIFSTYQSSPKIAEAFKKHELKPFDLIIADEAHRCAGKVAADYSTVLDSESLPAQRRLFMTATPRTYKSHLKKRAEEKGFEVASMDDESVFGSVLHHLTFGQAIANDPPLLTDYQVIVVGVNEALVKQMVDERALVELKGVATDAKTLAIQVGLAKAIREYDLTRVISFHSRVNLAKNFAAGFTEILGAIPEDKKPGGQITYSHVSGAMPTSQRTQGLQALASLESEDRYIMGNARCLSEGVDVPALDGVAFVDPRRSEIDIVQAVGRAIRRSSDKSVGTIIIPVFIEQDDDPDAIISSSQFDQVWKVVNALRAHDEALGEEIDALRRELGRQQQISLNGSKIVFDLPEVVGDDFLNALECRLVETCSSAWEENFALLRDYFIKHGHCRVKRTDTANIKLAQWVATQRLSRKSGKLTQDQIDRLDELDFIWNFADETWMQKYSLVKAFYDLNGHCLVPTGEFVGKVKLGRWVIKQRTLKDKMSVFRRKKLEAINFVWDVGAYVFEQHFINFEFHKQTYGHLRVVRSFERNGWDTGYYVNALRQTYAGKSKALNLTAEQIARLNNLGFSWNPSDEEFDYKFELLKRYQKIHGHCLVKQRETFEDEPLGAWVSSFRQRKATLPEEHKSKLDSIGFVWSVRSNVRPKQVPLERSIKILRPDMDADWNPDLNGGLLSSNFGPTSRRMITWECSRGHQWDLRISTRSRSKFKGLQACPVCREAPDNS